MVTVGEIIKKFEKRYLESDNEIKHCLHNEALIKHYIAEKMLEFIDEQKEEKNRS